MVSLLFRLARGRRARRIRDITVTILGNTSEICVGVERGFLLCGEGRGHRWRKTLVNNNNIHQPDVNSRLTNNLFKVLLKFKVKVMSTLHLAIISTIKS